MPTSTAAMYVQRKAFAGETGRVKKLGTEKTGADWLIEFGDGSLGAKVFF